MALEFKEDVLKLWKKFSSNPSVELRNKFMVMYLPVVRFTAERIRAKLPDEVDVDDLMSAGLFGLMDAIESFDLTRGVKFETYCAPRIRGAMLDELRSMDWVPRLVRSRASKLEGAMRALESELGRTPTDKEIAQRLGLEKEEFDKLLKDATAVSLVSLSRKHYETDSSRDVHEVDLVPDEQSVDPEFEAQKLDLKRFVKENLNRLEQLVLVLYYHEEMTMKEIGAALDLSESRVSQMHSAIVLRIRKSLGVGVMGELSGVEC